MPAAMYFSQHKYVMDLLDELHVADCKSVQTPMTSTCSFANSGADSAADVSLYKRIIGKLHHISFTRPNIGFIVSKSSEFMHAPKLSHRKTVKHLLCYLKQTSTMGIKLCRQPTDRFLAYSDSGWAGKNINHTLCCLPWELKHSSMEAEYRAVAAAVSEVNWVTNLLHELHFQVSTPPTIFFDEAYSY